MNREQIALIEVNKEELLKFNYKEQVIIFDQKLNHFFIEWCDERFKKLLPALNSNLRFFIYPPGDLLDSSINLLKNIKINI